jgi:hypothetical protein
MCRAEVKIMLKTEYSSYIQFERLTAYVWVWNDREQPLVVGEGGTSLMEFHVGRNRDSWEKPLREGSPVGNFRLEPGERRRLAVDLTAWYDVGVMGRYFLRAYVKDGADYTFSPDVVFDVVSGIEVETLTREVAGYHGVSRTYSLRMWKRGPTENLFLCVRDEPSGLQLGVFPLGRAIRLSAPVVRLEGETELTVRHQQSRDGFLRTVFRSDGKGVEFIDQRLELENGDPYPASGTRMPLPFPELRDEKPRDRGRK